MKFKMMKFKMMKFKIVWDGEIIAAFLNASDRDSCLNLFREIYDDCIFEAQDDK